MRNSKFSGASEIATVVGIVEAQAISKKLSEGRRIFMHDNVGGLNGSTQHSAQTHIH
jgi:hypothetical protein